MRRDYDVVIIGGGAAGLAAGCFIGLSGRRLKVAILEHSSRVGSKLLSTGNGRCNLSNESVTAGDYSGWSAGSKEEFAKAPLSAFTPGDARDFFAGLGVPLTSKEGRLYPRALQASGVLDALRFCCVENNVEIITLANINNMAKREGAFEIKGDIGDEAASERLFVRAGRVILATGGLAAPRTGSDGSGYALAKGFGHSVTDTMPHLAPLKSNERFLTALSGVRTEAVLSLYAGDRHIADNSGELQFTKQGISGIVSFELCAQAGYALKDNQKVTVYADLLPKEAADDLISDIRHRKDIFGSRSCADMLLGIANKKIVTTLCKLSGVSAGKNAAEFTDEAIISFTRLIKALPIRISGISGYDDAQVTAGGIDTRDIDPHTMGSRLCPGLYFAGEIVDVTGRCGGYNLHWCWASAFSAVKSLIL